jgi:hypothetical protein
MLYPFRLRRSVIEYNDGIQDLNVILDFHKEANKAQKIIYHNMIEARKKQNAESEKRIAELEEKRMDKLENYKFDPFKKSGE